MASFDFGRCSIDFARPNGTQASSAELLAMPSGAQPAISFVHEYVHFIQQVSSPISLMLVADILDLAIKGALFLDGAISTAGGVVPQQEVLPLLQGTPSGAIAANPELKARAAETARDCKLLFGDFSVSYPGNATAWQVVSLELPFLQEKREFWGLVTPRGRFRPFSPRMLAECMARRIDRWFATTMGFNHQWPPSCVEDELYNGIRFVLGTPDFSRNVVDRNIDDIVVVACHLALATSHPDRAMRLMLELLSSGRDLGGLVQAVAPALRKVLVDDGILHAVHFNVVMKELLEGPVANVINRGEFLDLFTQLTRVHKVANQVLYNPLAFVIRDVDWNRVVEWMRGYTLCEVVATDGPLQSIAGVNADPAASKLLGECFRTIWG